MTKKILFPLCRQLEILFEIMLDPDGRPYSLTELAKATDLTLNTVSRLKTGRITDPRLSTLIAICDFFGVGLDYFNCTSEAECYQVLAQINHKHERLPEIVTRVRGMTHDIIGEIERFRAYIDQLDEQQSQT